MNAKMMALFLTAISVAWFASPSDAVTMKVTAPAVQKADRQKSTIASGDKVFGVMDDNPVAAAASQMGFGLVKRSIWIAPTNNAWDNPSNNPRVTPLPEKYREAITATMEEARAAGMPVIIELYPIIRFGPPRGPSQMRGTCDVAKDIVDRWPDVVKGVEVGVEPNNYTFDRAQFGPDGKQVSAANTLKWTGICWDLIKKTHPDVLIVGGSLASRGEDDPRKKESSTSPVLFLQKFCEAYKASGRTRPVMDWFDMHFYVDPEDQSPDVTHPYPSTTITMADGDKLESLLACFDGTGQPRPPVWWGEGGYNTAVPEGMIGTRYSRQGKAPTIKLINEQTQGSYFAKAVQLAFCQPYSIGLGWFHLVDDPDRKNDWQSGFAYAPLRSKRGSSTANIQFTYKQSVPAVRKALVAVNNGTIKCGPPGSP